MTVESEVGAALARADERRQSADPELVERGLKAAEIAEAEGITVAEGRALQCFDPVRQAVFLRKLAETPIVGVAAKAAGVSVSTCYRLRKRSRVVSAAWDEMLGQSVDTLEGEAVRRAMVDSDRLLIELLRAKRPEEYSPKADVEVHRVEFVVDLVPGHFVPTVECEEAEVVDEDGKVLEEGGPEAGPVG